MSEISMDEAFARAEAEGPGVIELGFLRKQSEPLGAESQGEFGNEEPAARRSAAQRGGSSDGDGGDHEDSDADDRDPQGDDAEVVADDGLELSAVGLPAAIDAVSDSEQAEQEHQAAIAESGIPDGLDEASSFWDAEDADELDESDYSAQDRAREESDEPRDADDSILDDADKSAQEEESAPSIPSGPSPTASTAQKVFSSPRPSRTTGLPRTGFRVKTGGRDLLVRNLPKQLLLELRERVRASLERERPELESSDVRGFAESVSQSALVMAFLMATLDIEISVDETTGFVCGLLRAQDPLLGAVVGRLDDLEEQGVEQSEYLALIDGRLRDMERREQALEQMGAFLIADQLENLLRFGEHTVGDFPIMHRSTLRVRDRVREEMVKQQRREREREGRPMR